MSQNDEKNIKALTKKLLSVCGSSKCEGPVILDALSECFSVVMVNEIKEVDFEPLCDLISKKIILKTKFYKKYVIPPELVQIQA